MGLWERFTDWLTCRHALEWTVLSPRKPGWYWAEYAWGSVLIVLVGEREGRLCVLDDDMPEVLTCTEIVRWSGPIRMPALPQSGKAQ